MADDQNEAVSITECEDCSGRGKTGGVFGFMADECESCGGAGWLADGESGAAYFAENFGQVREGPRMTLSGLREYAEEHGDLRRDVPGFEEGEEVEVMHGTAGDFDGEDLGTGLEVGEEHVSKGSDMGYAWVTEDHGVAEQYAHSSAEHIKEGRWFFEDWLKDEPEPKIHHYEIEGENLEEAEVGNLFWWEQAGGYGVDPEQLDFQYTEELGFSDDEDEDR